MQVGYILYSELSDGRDTEGNEYSNSVWFMIRFSFAPAKRSQGNGVLSQSEGSFNLESP